MTDTPSDISLADRVHARLREEILSAARPAGSTMRERDIADELGVSRVPVRAALPRLESSGLVRTSPRRPAVITAISTEDVTQLFDLRSTIEPGLAALAARAVSTGAPTEALRSSLDDAEKHLAAGHDAAFQRSNAALHDAVVALTGNALALSFHALLDDRVERLNRVSFHHDDERRHGEHVDMCEAILSGHDRVAEAATVVHIARERERVLSALPQHPHYAGH